MLRFHAGSVEETVEIGRKLGKILQKGDTVCLTGALGAGKTAFAGGIARALDINEYITSPTFTIINEYEGRLPLYHFDVYRLAGKDDMLDTGYYEYINGDGVTVIEWADLVKELLPENRIDVNIERDSRDNADSRMITISFRGEKTAAYEGRLPHEGAGD